MIAQKKHYLSQKKKRQSGSINFDEIGIGHQAQEEEEEVFSDDSVATDDVKNILLN